MIQNISNYINIETVLAFWFRNSGPASSFELVFWSGFFLIQVVLALGIFIYGKYVVKNYPPKQKFLNSVFLILLLFGLSGFLFVPLRTLSPNFLAMRAIPLFVWLIGLFWSGLLLYRYFKKTPSETLKFETRVLKERYFKKTKS